MKKGVSIFVLALVSLINLTCTVFTAFASEPNVVITPLSGLPGESFDFTITATSRSTVSGVKVEDPDGDTWVLKGWTGWSWRSVTIHLPDSGDSIQLTWSDATYSASYSVKIDPDSDIRVTDRYEWRTLTDLKWVNSGELPHTHMMGDYLLSFSGYGCKFSIIESFFIVPEGPLGTIGAVMIMFSVFALRNRKYYTRA